MPNLLRPVQMGEEGQNRRLQQVVGWSVSRIRAKMGEHLTHH
jgi:hypothetical protein